MKYDGAITPEELFEKITGKKKPWRVISGNASKTAADYYDHPIFIFVSFNNYALVIQKTARTWIAYEAFKDSIGPYLRIYPVNPTDAWVKYNRYMANGIDYCEPTAEDREQFKLDMTIKSL
jgi:hypothetical protein